MPPEGLQLFTRLCLSVLETGIFPDVWYDVKVVLIPKKSGFLSFKDLRPLAIAPVPYRLFGKALLSLSGHAMSQLHGHSVGGVPGRSAQQALFKVCFIIEKVRSAKGSFPGLAIDTQKFFDCIPHALAYTSLLLIGVPPLVVHTWLSFVLGIRRFVSLKGSVSPVPIFSDRGIPQGDPISMLAAAAPLAVWLTDLEVIPPSPKATAWVFVDDRLLAEEHDGPTTWLQEAFSLTNSWDSSWGFSTRPKTVCFGFGPAFQALAWPDFEPVAIDVAPKYLGIVLPPPSVF